MNPRIFDVNIASIILRKYFLNWEDLISLMFEIFIGLFTIQFLYHHPYIPTELSFPTVMTGIFLSIAIFLIAVPYGFFSYSFLALSGIFLVITLRKTNYLVFVFRTPWYVDMILPEE